MWKILNIFTAITAAKNLKMVRPQKLRLLLKMRTVTADFSA